MQNNKAAQAFLFFGKVGCFLPILIFFNLFFGLIFFDFRTWFFVEVVLVALFFFVLFVTMKTANSVVSRGAFRSVRKSRGVIDVEAKVVDGPQEDTDKREKLN
ncbi:MAG: hypothetical protein WDL87_08315 [Candidatus Omnitrophota bacterium]|jgi:hypothetical protein